MVFTTDRTNSRSHVVPPRGVWYEADQASVRATGRILTITGDCGQRVVENALLSAGALLHRRRVNRPLVWVDILALGAIASC